jgi:hypothetical protein
MRTKVQKSHLIPVNPQNATSNDWVMRLTDAERWRLGIKTIRSIDAAETPQERKNRQRRERRAKARTNRPPQLSQSKPWEAEGICRRTWVRRRKRPVAKHGPSILGEYYAGTAVCDTAAIPSANADGGEVAALRLKSPPRRGSGVPMLPKADARQRGTASQAQTTTQGI